MNHPRILVCPDPQTCALLAADHFEELILSKPACVLGLATGATPVLLYRELVARYKAGRIDFSRVRSANLDEYRGLSGEHPQSYRYFMQYNLFNQVNIKPENTIVPNGLTNDVAAMSQAYEAQIEAWGGIDLQLLGLGHDGHIGFNEPDDHFPVHTHEATLTAMTREANKKYFDSPDEMPTSAYTMGIGTIMAARQVLMIATNEAKADILKQAFFGPVTPQVPASILQFHPDVTVIVDKITAKLL